MSSSEKRFRHSKPKPDHNSASVDLSVLQNIPPHNLEAERGVIASMIADPMIVDDVIIMLSEDMFYSDAHRRIYKHLKEMRGDGCAVDMHLLLDRLRKAEEIDAIGGQAYLFELMTSNFLAFNVRYYAQLVQEKYALRRLIHAGSTIVQEAFAPGTDTKDLVHRAAQQMFDLCDSQTSNQVTSMNDVMLDIIPYVEGLLAGKHDGISTGFAELDEYLNGLRPNELIILAARPGKGKTALGMNIAEHVAIDQKKPVLVVSLEMAKRELALRLICSRGTIESNKIRKKFLSNDEQIRFHDVVNEISQAPMYFDDTPNRTISEIAAVARRLKHQAGLQLLIVDYLTLITPDNLNDPRQEQVAKMARRLKGLARELHIPVFCLAQLNRQMEQGKEMEPKLSHLRESGAIEQDADIVLLIHHKTIKDKTTEHTEDKSFIIVAKNRAGATGIVEIGWEKEYTRFIGKAEQDRNAIEEFGRSYASDFSGYAYDSSVESSGVSEVSEVNEVSEGD